MKKITLTSLLLTLLFLPGVNAMAGDGVLVVSNLNAPDLTLTREQVRNLFMGASLGYGLRPVVLPPGHPARAVFNTRVVGLTETRINAYWAQMRFTGRLTPPRQLDDVTELLTYLKENPGYVGYIPASVALPPELSVLYRTNN
ncbi:hypothetical protein ACQUQU_03055 [Thalassolituus sp. LLYu03]|uniref:hypothetical protein n=1 Tax=Thalassolituus sp. LLYu03 TaxID=3421656 RepID=UPI003D2899D5